MTTNQQDKKTYYVVKVIVQPSGAEGYIKQSLNVNSFLNGSIELTFDRKEAERFGKDFGQQVANKRNGKLVKVRIRPSRAKQKVIPPTITLPPPQERFIYVGLAIDSSGSMDGLQVETVKAVNQIIAETKEAAEKTGITTRLSMWLFGVPGNIQQVMVNQDIKTVTPMKDLRPYGNTPLYDCVGAMMETFDQVNATDTTSFLLHTITDGQENASTKYHIYSHKQTFGKSLKDEIRARQATDKWTFTFLLPPGYKQGFVNLSGVPEGNCREWEGTIKGVRDYVGAMTTSTQGYFQGAAAATRSVKTNNFFETDLSKVNTSDLKKKLTDVANKFVSINVDREQAIEDLIKAKGYTYCKGNAFYTLSKPEKIQSHKKILIKEKNGKAVYGGKEARDVLGLPDYEVKVKPGNHANYDIFVESNSTNRKCVRGTKVLYLLPNESLT